MTNKKDADAQKVMPKIVSDNKAICSGKFVVMPFYLPNTHTHTAHYMFKKELPKYVIIW